MMNRNTLRALGVAALLGGTALVAQSQTAGHDMSAMAAEDMQPSTQAFTTAGEQMMMNMPKEFTGDANVDFARSMIAHHNGAIDMAEVMLEYGDDPELRTMAEEIIAAQTEEIATLTAWLEENAE